MMRSLVSINDREEESKLSGNEFDFERNMNGGDKPPPLHQQPATAAANSIHWDVDEDHLLSYFLGANEGAQDTIPESDVAVEVNDVRPASVRPGSQPNSTANMASLAWAGATMQPARAMGSSGGLSTSSSSIQLLPTPAAHFYNDAGQPTSQQNNQGQQQPLIIPGAYNSFVHASQQQRRHSNSSFQQRTNSTGSMHRAPSRTTSATSVGGTDSGSSSSSLASMAAALALGGPNQVAFMQQKLQSRDQLVGVPMNSTSPITPVNMMGSPSGQEMMMLPPPPRFPNGVAVQQQQQHQPGVMMQMPQGNMQKQMMQQQQQQMMQQQKQQQVIQHQQILQQHQHQQMVQQQLMQQQNQHSMSQQQMPQQVVLTNYRNHQPVATNAAAAPLQDNVAQNQQQQHNKPNFLPQMNPLAGVGPMQQARMQHPQPSMAQANHMGFPDPNSVASTVLAQPLQRQQSQQQQQLQVPLQHQPQPQHQQIQIGMNGHSIPVTAVPGANGAVYYQVDPSAAGPGAVMPHPNQLRYFTKAINEVSRPEEKEVDPKILAEKRQQRLARNRESARQSRRRKKEHLNNLGSKVQKLQRQLENEVGNKIRSMDAGLARQRGNLIDRWLREEEKMRLSEENKGNVGSAEGNECERRQRLVLVFRKTGPDTPIRRAVVAHQYNLLQQAFLSTHNQFSVWMMMQSSAFFTEASRRRAITVGIEEGGGGARGGTSPRANSKQIGEELYYEERNGGSRAIVTCHANEQLRTWPLYCHEITMTMEQEDRIINQAHGEAKATPNLQAKLTKIKTATDATRHLQNAMLCHTKLASQRNDALLLDILTPTQTALFLEWMKNNRERCRAVMERRLRSVAVGNAEGESTLVGVCRQLEEMRLQA